MYRHHLYLIENHTHMHVGSGDANFDLVDRQIQRDPVTNYPVVHASSLKGALREYCEYRNANDENPAETFVAKTFGDEKNAGNVRFIDARLLAFPVRSDVVPYFLCTSPTAVREFIETVQVLGIEVENIDKLRPFAEYEGSGAAGQKATLETVEVRADGKLDFAALEAFVGAPAAIVSNSNFKTLLKDLPVIARNQLDNGESKNLWYEEVLPRKSRLYTVISDPTFVDEADRGLENHFDRLHRYLTDGATIQLGANASVGYGVCTFKELGYA